MLLRKVARHSQVGRRNDYNERARNDPRAIPAVEDADVTALYILLPFSAMEPEPLYLRMKLCYVDRFSNKSDDL
jgi:hypothetical protein